MKTPARIGVSVVVLLIGGCSTGCYFVYQHHLSYDVKRLLVAANDEHSSMAEIHEYMAQARPLVRTKRDREVLGQFEEGVALYEKIQEDEREDVEAQTTFGENDECYRTLKKDVQLRDQYHRMNMKPPKELLDSIQADLKTGEECLDRKASRRIRQSQETEVREKQDRELAVQDFNSVRKRIGLPLLPVPKQ